MHYDRCICFLYPQNPAIVAGFSEYKQRSAVRKGAPGENDYESGMRRSRGKLLLALMGGSMSL